MKSNSMLIIRIVLLVVFTGFIAGFVVSQYEFVRTLVTVVCLSCVGVG